MFAEGVVGMQFERTKVKLFCFNAWLLVCLGVGRRVWCRRPHEGERGVRILRPDREIARRDGQPSETEHVSARLSDVSGLLPGNFTDDLIDGQFYLPCLSPLRASWPNASSADCPIEDSTPCARTSNVSSCNAKVASASFNRVNSLTRGSFEELMTLNQPME